MIWDLWGMLRCAKSWYQGQGQLLWDVVNGPCPWYLLLVQHSWYYIGISWYLFPGHIYMIYMHVINTYAYALHIHKNDLVRYIKTLSCIEKGIRLVFLLSSSACYNCRELVPFRSMRFTDGDVFIRPLMFSQGSLSKGSSSDVKTMYAF